MIRKYLLYIFVLFSITVCADNSPKDKPTPLKTLIKDGKQAIKNKRDQKNKEKALLEALQREGLTAAEKADIYSMVASLECSINDDENLKAYLKQKYDTANYYNTMLAAVKYTLLCDSLDIIPDKTGAQKPRYQGKNRDLLLLYRPNIYRGGRFFLRKADYAQAYQYMAMYTDFQKTRLLAGNSRVLSDTLVQYSTYYAVLSAFATKQPKNALKYVDEAIIYADSAKCPVLHEYKVRCMQELGRKDEWLKYLWQGVKLYPKHDYFFINLAQYYEDNKMYDAGIALADSMLNNVQDATIYWYSKSLMYLHKEKWLQCAEMADKVLQREPEHVSALYNKAVSYVNEALDLALVACTDVRKAKYKQDKDKMQQLYEKAKQPSEELRRLRPEALNTWGPLLYRVYLNLNMGNEFSEIETLLKSVGK